MSGFVLSSSSTLSRKRRLVTEERANQITHGLGTLLALAGAIALTRVTGQSSSALQLGCTIYGTSLVLLYAASTLSHSFLSGRWKHTFRTVDQVLIFLMMASCYTPLGLTICRSDGLWIVMAAMWAMALAGVVMKLFVSGIQMVPLWFYVVTAWMPILAMPRMFAVLPIEAMGLVFAGAAVYMLGVLFFANDHRRYFHCVWHLCVIGGSTCHYLAVYHYVVPLAG